jgi:hypothetical protein
MCEKLLEDLTNNDAGKTIKEILLKLDEEGDRMLVIYYTDGTWTVFTYYDLFDSPNYINPCNQ